MTGLSFQKFRVKLPDGTWSNLISTANGFADPSQYTTVFTDTNHSIGINDGSGGWFWRRRKYDSPPYRFFADDIYPLAAVNAELPLFVRTKPFGFDWTEVTSRIASNYGPDPYVFVPPDQITPGTWVDGIRIATDNSEGSGGPVFGTVMGYASMDPAGFRHSGSGAIEPYDVTGRDFPHHNYIYYFDSEGNEFVTSDDNGERWVLYASAHRVGDSSLSSFSGISGLICTEFAMRLESTSVPFVGPYFLDKDLGAVIAPAVQSVILYDLRTMAEFGSERNNIDYTQYYDGFEGKPRLPHSELGWLKAIFVFNHAYNASSEVAPYYNLENTYSVLFKLGAAFAVEHVSVIENLNDPTSADPTRLNTLGGGPGVAPLSRFTAIANASYAGTDIAAGGTQIAEYFGDLTPQKEGGSPAGRMLSPGIYESTFEDYLAGGVAFGLVSASQLSGALDWSTGAEGALPYRGQMTVGQDHGFAEQHTTTVGSPNVFLQWMPWPA